MRFLLKLAIGLIMALMLSGAFCYTASAHSHAHFRGSVYIGPAYGPYYGPYYDPWYDPYYPYGGPYYYVPPPNYGWLWTQVEPNTAEVWVDGKRFGLVKDYDGPVNHLRLPLGDHEAQFRLPDYETYTVGFTIYPDETTTVNYELRPLPAGSPPPAVQQEQGAPGGEGEYQGEYGTLLVDAQPGGSSIFIDGEYRATSTDQAAEAVISVQPGRRQVRISKEGYMDYFTEAMVKPGSSTHISVRLKKR